jgi:NAD(P)-dependent dehydrogenase (short-subunit alcohol dehydrogenase family)
MNGRTALVTGASRGIGAAVAARFAALGAKVLAPPRAELDLNDGASIAAYLERLEGTVDILVNNAGVNWPQQLMELEDKELDETLRVNLAAPARLTRGLAPGMVARGYGRIVNVSSVWALVSREGRSAYAASKAGLLGLTRTMALELAPAGVLVNAVAPGYVATDLTSQNNTRAQLGEIEALIPVGRLGEPEEIAELIAFLCSARNSYVTGQVLVCDGGYTCR